MLYTKRILNRLMTFSLMVSVGFVALLYMASPASAQISLGTAEAFAVLGGQAVTNTGGTVLTGDLGIWPKTASSVTGFPPGSYTGTLHAADAVAAQAQVDLTTAYNAIVATPTLVDLTGTDLGGLTLTPGVYGFDTSAQLTGALTLATGLNPNAVFIFKIASTLTTASASSVTVTGAGSDCNVFWQVGSSATLGSTTTFAGNILALQSISLNTGASVSGRILARNGSVTMDTNAVDVCAAAICPVITLSPAALPAGVVGTFYSETVTASGSTNLPYAYAVSSGALPDGLGLNGATGAITGMPTTAGTFNFTITATDSLGCTGSHLYSIVIADAGCPAITLSPTTLPAGVISTPYSKTVTASGGTAPYTYTVSSGALPDGLGLNSTTGAITGTPTTAGVFSFIVTATDNNDCTGNRAYSILITACPPITLSPATLPAGVISTPYSKTVTASGGTAPYTYTVSSGALPDGLGLNSTTGAITGTPTTAGVFSFIVTATDDNGCTGLQAYTIAVNSVVIATPVPTLSEWGMIIFMVLMGLGAIYYLRRRRIDI